MLSRFSHVRLSAWTVARQVPLSLGFSRQEYWSGLPFPPPGDLPDSGFKPMSLMSPALVGEFFYHLRHPGSLVGSVVGTLSGWRGRKFPILTSFLVIVFIRLLKRSSPMTMRFYIFNICLFICLHWFLIATCRIFSCGMWNLVPWLGIKHRTLALSVWSIRH